MTAVVNIAHSGSMAARRRRGGGEGRVLCYFASKSQNHRSPAECIPRKPVRMRCLASLLCPETPPRVFVGDATSCGRGRERRGSPRRRMAPGACRRTDGSESNKDWKASTRQTSGGAAGGQRTGEREVGFLGNASLGPVTRIHGFDCSPKGKAWPRDAKRLASPKEHMPGDDREEQLGHHPGQPARVGAAAHAPYGRWGWVRDSIRSCSNSHRQPRC